MPQNTHLLSLHIPHISSQLGQSPTSRLCSSFLWSQPNRFWSFSYTLHYLYSPPQMWFSCWPWQMSVSSKHLCSVLFPAPLPHCLPVSFLTVDPRFHQCCLNQTITLSLRPVHWKAECAHFVYPISEATFTSLDCWCTVAITTFIQENTTHGGPLKFPFHRKKH